MVVDTTIGIVVGAVTAAFDITLTCVNGHRLSKVERMLKINRIELTSLELVSTLSIIANSIESHLWRKDFSKLENNIHTSEQFMMDRINTLYNQIDSAYANKIHNEMTKEEKK